MPFIYTQISVNEFYNQCYNCKDMGKCIYIGNQKVSGYLLNDCINCTAIPKTFISNTDYNILDDCFELCNTCEQRGTLTQMNCLTCFHEEHCLVDDLNNCVARGTSVDYYYMNPEPDGSCTYKKCYYTCLSCNGEGNSENNNCINCAEGYQPDPQYEGNCVKVCDYYWYIDPTSQKYTCTEGASCPRQLPYLAELTKECLSDCIYAYNFETTALYKYQKTCVIKCPENTMKDNLLYACYSLDDSKEIFSHVQNYISYQSLPPPNLLIYSNDKTKYFHLFNTTGQSLSLYRQSAKGVGTSLLDLSYCLTTLRNQYGYGRSEVFYIGIMDVIREDTSAPQFEFTIHDHTGVKLDINKCKDDTIVVNKSFVHSVDMSLAREITSNYNYDIINYNKDNKFFCDICTLFQYDKKDPFDVILNDRYSSFYQNKDYYFCEDFCDAEKTKVYLDDSRVECICKGKKSYTSLQAENFVQFNKINKKCHDWFLQYFKCANNFFKKNFFKNNYASVLMFLFFLMQILSVFLFFFFSLKKLRNSFIKVLEKKSILRKQYLKENPIPENYYETYNSLNTNSNRNNSENTSKYRNTLSNSKSNKSKSNTYTNSKENSELISKNTSSQSYNSKTNSKSRSNYSKSNKSNTNSNTNTNNNQSSQYTNSQKQSNKSSTDVLENSEEEDDSNNNDNSNNNSNSKTQSQQSSNKESKIQSQQNSNKEKKTQSKQSSKTESKTQSKQGSKKEQSQKSNNSKKSKSKDKSITNSESDLEENGENSDNINSKGKKSENKDSNNESNTNDENSNSNPPKKKKKKVDDDDDESNNDENIINIKDIDEDEINKNAKENKKSEKEEQKNDKVENKKAPKTAFQKYSKRFLRNRKDYVDGAYNEDSFDFNLEKNWRKKGSQDEFDDYEEEEEEEDDDDNNEEEEEDDDKFEFDEESGTKTHGSNSKSKTEENSNINQSNKISKTNSKLSKTNSKNTRTNSQINKTNSKNNHTISKKTRTNSQISKTNNENNQTNSKNIRINSRISKTISKNSNINSKNSNTISKISKTNSKISKTVSHNENSKTNSNKITESEDNYNSEQITNSQKTTQTQKLSINKSSSRRKSKFSLRSMASNQTPSNQDSEPPISEKRETQLYPQLITEKKTFSDAIKKFEDKSLSFLYWYILKKRHRLVALFMQRDKYDFFSIKFSYLILSYILDFFFITFFFLDYVIRYVYEKKKHVEPLCTIILGFGCPAVSHAVMRGMDFLMDNIKKKFKEYETKDENVQKNYMYTLNILIKEYTKEIIIYFSIVGIFSLFVWYMVGTFIATFYYIQKMWLIIFGISFLLNNFFPLIFYIIAVKLQYEGIQQKDIKLFRKGMTLQKI